MIFEDYISVSASIVISANTYTEADGCVSLLYVPTPAWPTGPCNPVAWFSSSIITFVFLEEVWTFDPSQDISGLASRLASAAGLPIGANFDTDTNKVVLFDLVPPAESKIAYGNSNFNSLISNVPLADASSLSSSSASDTTISTFSNSLTDAELYSSDLSGGWFDPPFNKMLSRKEMNRPDSLIGYQGGTFAPFAPGLARAATFLNRLSSSTINALKALNTYELTGCPFGK